MSSAADRRMRGRRNRLVDILGLGHPAPIIDLSVLLVPGKLAADDPAVPPATAPVMVPFGDAATIVVEDAEPEVTYRVRANGSGTSLSKRPVRDSNRGGRLDLVVPRIDLATTFSVEATTPHGRTALLTMTREVLVGLETAIPADVAGFAAAPVLIDHGGGVTVVMARSQKAVSYSLVVQSPADALRGDPRLDTTRGDPPEGRVGDGGPIELVSGPLTDDAVLRIRADRSYGKGQRQAVLLDARLAVYVRADRVRPVTIAPGVSDHLASARVTIGGTQARVRYDLVIGTLSDADIARVAPAAPTGAAVTVKADGTSLFVTVPVPGDRWRPLPGHVETGATGEGGDADLSITTPPLPRDGTIVVRAVKRHAIDDAVFYSAVPLAQPVVALVRPAPAPAIRIVATVDAGMLVRLALHGGEPGVFYALAADGERLSELYVHQVDPVDPTRNKGIGRIEVATDLVVAGDPASAAPPPVPHLDLAAALPITITMTARRATTGLRQALDTAVPIARPPQIGIPIAAAEGTAVTVTPASQERQYRVIVDGVPYGDAVAGAGRSVVLDTGAIGVGATIVLAIDDPVVAGCAVTRRIPVQFKVG